MRPDGFGCKEFRFTGWKVELETAAWVERTILGGVCVVYPPLDDLRCSPGISTFIPSPCPETVRKMATVKQWKTSEALRLPRYVHYRSEVQRAKP